MARLFIDLETYYEEGSSKKNYNLKNLNYFQYMTDPKFKVLGLSYAIKNSSPEWVDGDDIPYFIKSLRTQNITHTTAHNMLYDGLLLTHFYGLTSDRWEDTLSMARAKLPSTQSLSLDNLARYFGVGEKLDINNDPLDQYANNDVILLRNIFNKLRPYPATEMKVIDLTLRMAFYGQFRLNVPLAKSLLKEEIDRRNKILSTSPIPIKVLNSNKQFSTWVQSLGIDVPKKISVTTGKLIPALAKKDDGINDLKGLHPDLDAAIEARINTKSSLIQTRLETFLDTYERMGRIPTILNYYGGHTGRWSGSIYNLQNLPKKGQLRNVLIPPEGCVFIIVDLSSIEARVLLWLAYQIDAIENFAKGICNYKTMASAIYKIDYDLITSDQRALGKQTVLGAGYGMGTAKFLATCKDYGIIISEEEADLAINTYRTRFYKVPQLWRLLQSKLPAMIKGYQTTLNSTGSKPLYSGMFPQSTTSTISRYHYSPTPDIKHGKLLTFKEEAIVLPNGMDLKYPDLRQQNGEWFYYSKHRLYGGKLAEHVTQALARIVFAEQTLKIQEELCTPVLLSHDEAITIAPKEKADAYLDTVTRIMSTAPPYFKGLPLGVSGGIQEFYTKM